jgi:drug/metabolite transporter (DMT)-like permease
MGLNGVVIRRSVTADVSLSATTVLMSTGGAVVLFLWSLVGLGPERMAETSPAEYRAMWTAGLLNAIAFFSVSAALRLITVVRANLLNASQTAMAALAGVMWFGESLTVWLIWGTALTMIGLLLLDRRTPKPVVDPKSAGHLPACSADSVLAAEAGGRGESASSAERDSPQSTAQQSSENVKTVDATATP